MSWFLRHSWVLRRHPGGGKGFALECRCLKRFSRRQNGIDPANSRARSFRLPDRLKAANNATKLVMFSGRRVANSGGSGLRAWLVFFEWALLEVLQRTARFGKCMYRYLFGITRCFSLRRSKINQSRVSQNGIDNKFGRILQY